MRVHPFLAPAPPHLFGHRGASGEAPENTLASFERAWAAGVAYLETDCRATRDGEIVLLHDASVERTTDGDGSVSELGWAQVQRLDAGHRFSSDGGATFPFRARGVRIPRLADMIEAFPDARINLEIKQAQPDIVAEVLRVIRGADAEERFLLAAEDDAIMERIRAADPGTAVGTSMAGVAAFYKALADGRIAEFEPQGQALQIPARALGQDLVTPEALAAAHALGLRVHVWTVNDPDEMRRLLRLGVDGLMSDFPERLVREARV